MQVTEEQHDRIYAEIYSELVGRAKWNAQKYVWDLNYTECYETIWGVLKGYQHATDNFPRITADDFEEMFAEAWRRFAGPYNPEDKETQAVMQTMRQQLTSPAALRAYVQDAIRIACYERATSALSEDDDTEE